MQRCLSIISDKSIVGGAVNRAKEMLETSGDRGRELRALRKSKGGGKKGSKSESVAKPEAKESEPADADPTPTEEADSKAAVVDQISDNGGAEPAPETVASGTDDLPLGTDLDQVTRRAALLQEEVQTLKDRLKTFEEDNKKWRQLAGRDTLTGLNNKVMLFRLVLPKAMKRIGNGMAFSCIGIGLDRLNQANVNHGWMMDDRMLQEAVKGLKSLVEDGDELYRLDGANFVLFGPMTHNVARMRATEIRRRLAKASVQIDKTQLPLVSSMAVVTVERRSGNPVHESAEAMYKALVEVLYRAKEKGGNTVEMHSHTNF